MFCDVKSAGSECIDTAQASHEIENAVAAFTQKKVVMMLGGALVVRRGSRDIHESHRAVGEELFYRPINGCDPQGRDLLLCEQTDILGSQRSIGIVEDFSQNPLLLGRISHVEIL